MGGRVCFTFDDSHFSGWLAALPLFERCSAHATFFVSGAIDAPAVEAMQALRRAGHTVGLHSLGHHEAPDPYTHEYYVNQVQPQLAACEAAGIPIHCFAYPNNRRSPASDAALMQYFRRFRAGSRDASEDEIYVPRAALASTRVMRGMGIGDYYRTRAEDLLAKIRRAAETDTCITFFSHNITPNAAHIHMDSALLELCLAECARLGMAVLGLDEI